ncbi:DEAD/DEAH box helicase family protein [Mycobacteroides abscessus]|uniref:DEAD/DEAH box helicase family protein n=1 Tax=Mycobacteroides abscessus TaxID=36809 RepID=UPI00092C7666|nr:DEAD/DEAH box helicase family protein [Mycobacteroides abscessus]MDO3333020.1 DEAD/DEAH box helicase family protein [Mycobacteroides abscessus subsp. bolletii]QSM89530.1 DEAD/DEAH box helicase family protein [Mycobacteroides abscessus subsp. bolletii]SIC30329.1 DNA/RNA helicase [Mycobacteroides abscessus subsp. bolletii]SIJ69124.1 DNA/RNA helicase [Mycobacteroides abscessus subsp. bolletii]SKT28324.1 DNA/RNA helicase [Mycobacteroides abscessus subsp. bolletii]
MTECFVDPRQLILGGERRFTVQIERLLGLLRYAEVLNIDGSGDVGGDLLGSIAGQQWVFQAKWQRQGSVPTKAVSEVSTAMDHYRAHRGVVVTNVKPSRDAVARAQVLARTGQRIDFWTGADLCQLWEQAPEQPPRIRLRKYQSDAVAALVEDLNTEGRALLVLATGLGKTVVGGEVIAHHLSLNAEADILVVAHTKDLVAQLERAMWRHLPKTVKTQVLTGDEKPTSFLGVTFATVASALKIALSGYRPSLIMIDETHHVGEDGQYGQLLNELSEASQFGVTATPWRGDRYDIENHFGAASYKLGIGDGMRLGYLAQVDYRLFLDNIDWEVVKDVSRRSYSMKELNSKLFLPQRDEAIIDELITAWRVTLDPRAIVFCQTKEHAERMAELLSRTPEWRRAQAIHEGLKVRERQLRLLDFRAGRVPILTAVDILNEGVDIPDVNIICFARVTHSRRIFVQQLGRGLRLREGKHKVMALDFVSDLRRVAALLNLRRQANADEIEVIPNVPQSQISFNDAKAESLLEQWVLDAADLETANDDARLQFIDPERPAS